MLTLSVALAAQCPRPVVPRDGFPLDVRSPERVVYSDGVLAEGRLLLPSTGVPPCGWPLIVYVHSLGAHREQDQAWQHELASRGYAVWAYDVRGQGMTRFLNPTIGTTLFGPQERFDLGEQIAHVRQQYAGVVSATRVGVTGVSQGGIHCWMAAAQSGRPLTVAGRGTMVFPEISCVVGSDFVAEPIRHRVRGGTLFSSTFLEFCIADPAMQPYQIDAAFADEVRLRFLIQDPAGLEAMMRAEPGRVVEDELATTEVPILFHHAWHDSICGLGPIVDAARSLPATTPFRLVASTLGHSTPRNDYELSLRRELTRRWFDRFLWDERNGVEDDARFVLAWMPLDVYQHSDPTSLWRHAHVEELPDPATRPHRLYTTAHGELAETAARQVGPSTRITHDVPPGFDSSRWLADPNLRSVTGLTTAVPMSERSFSQVLPHGLDLVGSPVVSLHATPDAPAYALAALLSVRLPGSTETRMLTHWGIGVLDGSPGVAATLRFELSPIAARLPAGATLTLTIRNHWMPESPHLPGIVATPLFHDYRVDIDHGDGAMASWIELPVLESPAITLVAQPIEFDVTAPEPVEFSIDSDVERAGWSYLIAASLSGHSPGIALPGGELPIQLDPLTIAFAGAVGTPELQGFAGTLDGAGSGSGVLDLRGLPSIPIELVGYRLSFATWVFRSPFDLSGAASNPVDVFIR